MSKITEDIIAQLKTTEHFPVGDAVVYRIDKLKEMGIVDVDKLPFSIRVLLENVIRNYDGKIITLEDVNRIANWPEGQGKLDVPYMPSRVVLQDFTGVPLFVDLADMRDAMNEHNGDPTLINPLIPTDLVIDHSVQIDAYGSELALKYNLDREYERNTERYKLIKWAQKSFKNLRVVPPGSGIIHQVNLEYLSPVIHYRDFKGEKTAIPDAIVGTDSHTPMINGLGVMGWGVGGIEAEAVMLGQPYTLVLPEVIGVRLTGELPEGTTATDLVLTVVEMLRKHGVVGKFVEYFGPGLSKLSVPDRATLANMSPEYGATMGFFPIDDATLAYLKLTGRDSTHIEFIKQYTKMNKLFRTDDGPEPTFTHILELDMSTVKPSVSGPANPEERIPIENLKERTDELLDVFSKERDGEPGKRRKAKIKREHEKLLLRDGDAVIASITSCTNTSNPSVLVGAGLLARNAVKYGIKPPEYVKTSFAPGSKVVTEYIRGLGLEPYLQALRFHFVGYGCTTCIGNSGPLREDIEEAIKEKDLYVTSVLSGNRNFGGRIHALIRGNFLASPMLVVAYALAGTMNIDLTTEPIAHTATGEPVYLKDIWPSQTEIKEAIEKGVKPEYFQKIYANILDGDEKWQSLNAPASTLYQWDPESTYIRRPPYFANFKPGPRELSDIKGARVLVLLGDKVSTDHISPAGTIPEDSPAGKYLLEHNVPLHEFNTYGSRRGNHEVMMRGTFANVRVRNQLVPGKEGWWTKNFLTGEVDTIYDTAMQYIEKGIPALVLGGKQYGQGSSRDWAGKGPALLGVKVVIAKNFERIHRSNLIGMGVLPLQFKEGEGWQELGLDGTETYDILGISQDIKPKQTIKVIAHKQDGTTIEFEVIARLDTPVEVEYFRYGGILPFVVSKFLSKQN